MIVQSSVPDRSWPFLALALAVLAVFPLYGQVELTPKHADGMYAAGETVAWTVAQSPESDIARVTYTAQKNHTGEPIAEGILDLSSGPAETEITLEEPGSVLLNIWPEPDASAEAEDNGRNRRGRPIAQDGAIVDAFSIEPSLPKPDDFDAWWARKLAELDAVPANPSLEKVEIDISGIEYYKVTLDNVGGTHVRGQLAKPAKDGKFPAVLQVQWAGVYPLQREWVTGRAQQGWLMLNVLAHDMPIDDEAAIRELAEGELRNYPAIGNTDRETSYFLRMYLGDCQALKYLCSRPEWDGETLVVMGGSMGGQQSLVTVGLMGEKLGVTHMICGVPAGCDVGARTADRGMSYPFWPDQPEVMRTARYFDPVNFVPGIKAMTQISVGLYDTVCPPTSVLSAFNLIDGPKELIPMHSGHNGPGQELQDMRREAWLSALVKGESVVVKD